MTKTDRRSTPGYHAEALRLDAVTRAFGRGAAQVLALRDVNLTFPRATFTAVMGPSGSGKSTLMHCAAGLDRPTSGSVFFGADRADLASMPERKLTVLRRDRIGFVFQAFNLVPSLDVHQNVTLPMRLAGRRADRSEVADLLRVVGMSDRAGHRPAQLSGGQQQRVAIARALITRPEVVFADEPTGALDSNTSRDVLALLRRTVDDTGQTTVMVTHDPIAASYADTVVFLADGRVVDVVDGLRVEQISDRMSSLTVGS